MRALVIKTLEWILCCIKALSIDALVQAVALDVEDVFDPIVDTDFVLQACSNFVDVTATGCAKISHRSVKNFLSVKVNEDHALINIADAHTHAAQACILFLLSLQDDSKWIALPADPHQDAKNLRFSSVEIYASVFSALHLEKGTPSDIGHVLQRFLVQGPRIGRTRFGGQAFQKWTSLL